MKRLFYISLLIPCLLTLCSCGKSGDGGGEATNRTIRVDLVQSSAVYDFCDAASVGFSTDAGDAAVVEPSREGPVTMSASIQVSGKAANLWCFTPSISVPARITKTDALIDGMAFCTPAIKLSGKTSYSGSIKPITSAIVLDILDSKEIWSGKAITSVTIQAADGTTLAGDVTLNLQEARIGQVQNASSSITIDCTGAQVGTQNSATSLGAVILPCSFTGTITVTGADFSGTVTIDQALALQAGYVKHLTVDMNVARGALGFPKRLGIIGDSISTFEGIIPSSHRKYYPAGDVDDWKKTYWGLLINDYWHCELDVNTSWSGSSVAADKAGSVRTPFVDHSRLDLFQDPDCIILFGGTNDAIASNEIGLGEFSYDVALDQMNVSRRFRDAYIYVIRYLQEKHPGVQIICIIGTDVTGDYGASVETIAKHYNLPYVDFRQDKVAGKVTIYSGSHPDAAGHAYKARRIYEETLPLFQ